VKRSETVGKVEQRIECQRHGIDISAQCTLQTAPEAVLDNQPSVENALRSFAIHVLLNKQMILK